MTRHRSFKRLVRTRMTKTGESYTTARAALLAHHAAPAASERPPLATSDDEIRRRTGLGWEEWFDLLDDWGAATRSHREIARWVADKLGIAPLVWEAQAVTVSYERARGGRAVGEHTDGFTVSVQKTVAVPVDSLFDAFVDPSLRARWLTDTLVARSTNRPRTAHFDWADGGSRLHVTFVPKGDGRAAVVVSHARLADAAAVETMRARWRRSLTELATLLQGGSDV